jgi:hypothetical protein
MSLLMPPILHAQQDDNRGMYSTIGTFMLHPTIKQLLDALQHGALTPGPFTNHQSVPNACCKPNTPVAPALPCHLQTSTNLTCLVCFVNTVASCVVVDETA